MNLLPRKMTILKDIRTCSYDIIKTVIYLLKPAYAILLWAAPLKLLLYVAGMKFGQDLISVKTQNFIYFIRLLCSR